MLRKLLLSILAILAVTVLLFGTVLGLAQTRLAKAQISGMVEDSLTGDGQTAEVDQLEGFLPFDVRLGRFRLADDTGTWLEVDNARVKVSPTRLLAGEILVEEAGAERVAVHRTPVLPAQPEPPPSDEPFSLPAPPTLPESLPRATLERLYVERIELGEALIGEDAVFKLEGNATTGPEGRQARARLDVTRIDQATAALGLGASLDLAAETIGLELNATETGGLMAKLTGQPDAGNLDLSLTGDGPLDAWQAELRLAIERLVTANADLALAYADNPSLDLSLDVVPEAGALPEDIAAVLGERLELELAAGQRAPGQFGLDRLSLQSGIVTASGRIEARLDQDRLEGRIEVVAEDLARASGLAGQPLAGRVTLGLDAAGTFTEPRFQLSLDGSGISAGDLGLDTVSLAFDADLLGPLNEPFAGAAVEGTGSITGLTQAGEPLRPEDSLTLDLAATVPMQGEARVERLRLAGQHVSLSGTADVTMPELAGTARLDAQVPSIEALLAALGPDAPPDLAATGAVELGVDVTLAAGLEQIGVALDLRGQGLGGLPDQLDQLIGASPSVTSTVTLRPGESVLVDALDVSTAALQLQGDLALGLDESQSLSGQLQLSPFDLQTIEGLVGQPIGGVVTTSVQLGGTLPEPGLDADLRIDNLLVAERSFDRVSLTANAGQTAGSYGGTVALGVEQAGELVQLKSDFSLDQPRLTLANLALTGPSTELTGGAEIDLESLLATGELGGGIGDLAALQPWSGQALRGSVDLDASFDATGGTQDARLALFVDDLGGDFGTLRRAEIEADVADVMGRLGVDATVTASAFAQPEPGFALADARVSVTGDRELYAIEATAQGEMNGPFNVNATARADVLGDARAVYLDALDGVFQAQTIKLMSPAVLQLENGVLDIDQLDLRIGDASIQGNLNLDQGRNRAKAGLVIESLPMAMLAEFGAPPMQGELTGQVTLDGPLTAPLIDGTMMIADLVMMQGKERLGGPANVAIDIALADTEFVTNARVDGLGDGPITLDFRLPMQLSLQPFALDLPETLPLDGKVTAKSRLEPLVALAALDGQTVEGDLTLDLRIEGTVARPQVTGKLDIANGRIADALSGIILRDVTVAVVGQGDRLVVERFTASDTAQGRLDARGQCRHRSGPGLPLHARAQDHGSSGARQRSRPRHGHRRPEGRRNDRGGQDLRPDHRAARRSATAERRRRAAGHPRCRGPGRPTAAPARDFRHDQRALDDGARHRHRHAGADLRPWPRPRHRMGRLAGRHRHRAAAAHRGHDQLPPWLSRFPRSTLRHPHRAGDLHRRFATDPRYRPRGGRPGRLDHRDHPPHGPGHGS